VSRGKIDVYVTYLNFGAEGRKVVVNKELAELYINELRELAKENGLCDEIQVTEISKFPDVVNVENIEEHSDIELLKCLNMAIDNFIETDRRKKNTRRFIC